MKAVGRSLVASLALGVLVGSTGCTKSLDLKYEPSMPRLANIDVLGNASVGIGKFQDKRAWVKPGDSESESFVASEGAWKFGLTWQGKDYVPVKHIVQQLFVTELGKAGINAMPIDQVLPASDRKALSQRESSNERTRCSAGTS